MGVRLRNPVFQSHREKLDYSTILVPIVTGHSFPRDIDLLVFCNVEDGFSPLNREMSRW